MAEKPAVPECWQLVYPQHLFLPFFLLPHVRRLIFGPVNVCPATPPTILALFVVTFPPHPFLRHGPSSRHGPK